MEKNFRRLLISTETVFEEKSIEDWKLDQFVNALAEMLNDMRKSMNRPSSTILGEYKQRIDRLRQNIDPIKLEDQTFPRPPQIDIPVKEQQPETTTSVTQVEKPLPAPNKSERSHLNRQQQYIQSEEDKQDEIANVMSKTAKNLKNTAQNIHDIVQDDRKKINEVQSLVDTNLEKLAVQSRRLKHNAYNGSNCWIYLMLIIVIATFIYLTLFMRMFRKRTTTVIYSSSNSKLSLLTNSINETAINNTNITTTKSTDYISLLLNYANENHTDL